MRLIDADALLKELPIHPDNGLRSFRNASIMQRVRETVRNAPEIVLKCSECMFWDSDSGLSARMCGRWGKFTTKNEFCSRFFKP